MRRFVGCLLAVCCVFCFATLSTAGDTTKKTSDKSLSDTARDVKTEAVNVYHDSKEAVVRDVQSMKEDIPRGLKEAKESAIQQSKDAMNGAKKEFQDIRDNISNPKPASKTENK